MRNLATGEAPPPDQVAKRERQAYQTDPATQAQMSANQNSRNQENGTVTPPQPPPPRPSVAQTPDQLQAVEASTFRQTPLSHIQTPTDQVSQYFTADIPGPSTPAAEKSINNQIQVTVNSGRKLKPSDPRATAKFNGVDAYD